MLLLLIMLLTRCAGAEGLEPRWQALGAGAEWTRYADQDPALFQDAEGWTRSLFGSAGAGARWLAAAGFSDQRVRQASWSFRSVKRSLWLSRALTPHWGVEALGASLSTSKEWPVLGGRRVETEAGWNLGGGLTWCPQPENAASLTLNGRLQTMRQAYPSVSEKVLAAELNVARQAVSGRQRLGLLASRAGGDLKLAGLARAATTRGRLDLQASALVGHQINWFDVERLVLHDGVMELKTSLSAGLGWRAWRGLSLEASAGWEKVSGSESRWLFLGARWTRRSWATAP